MQYVTYLFPSGQSQSSQYGKYQTLFLNDKLDIFDGIDKIQFDGTSTKKIQVRNLCTVDNDEDQLQRNNRVYANSQKVL